MGYGNAGRFTSVKNWVIPLDQPVAFLALFSAFTADKNSWGASFVFDDVGTHSSLTI